MPSRLNYSLQLAKNQLDAITALIGSGGKVWLYKGAQENGPDIPTVQILVAGPFVFSGGFAPPATVSPLNQYAARLTPNALSNITALTSDQPTWWRVTNNAGIAGGAGIVDGSAGTSGTAMIITATQANQPVGITSWTIDSGNYGH